MCEGVRVSPPEAPRSMPSPPGDWRTTREVGRTKNELLWGLGVILLYREIAKRRSNLFPDEIESDLMNDMAGKPNP